MTKPHTRVCFNITTKPSYTCKSSFLQYIKYRCKHK